MECNARAELPLKASGPGALTSRIYHEIHETLRYLRLRSRNPVCCNRGISVARMAPAVDLAREHVLVIHRRRAEARIQSHFGCSCLGPQTAATGSKQIGQAEQVEMCKSMIHTALRPLQPALVAPVEFRA